MPRKKNVDIADQMDLIDVHPKNSKEIVEAARKYKRVQNERSNALKKECEQKQVLLAFIKQAKVKPLDDGKIKCRISGVTIVITPRDELVQVKEENE